MPAQAEDLIIRGGNGVGAQREEVEVILDKNKDKKSSTRYEDPSRAADAPAQAPAGWSRNYSSALVEAASTDRKILLFFSGSDWSSESSDLEMRVFASQAFKDYAADKLVLVKADFPAKMRLPPETVAQNAALKTRFKVTSFPTVYVIDTKERVLGRIDGYRGQRPDAYVNRLRGFVR